MHADPSPWPYDLVADIYDEDMEPNVSGADVTFYVQRCHSAAGPVLELGCGTGRITLPLVRAGATVVGIDRSLPMIRVLRRKAEERLDRAERKRLHVCCTKMQELGLAGSFARVLCPYSAIRYLTTVQEQHRTLRAAREALAPGGLLLLDVFDPDPSVERAPRGRPIFDYLRPRSDGTFLERTKLLHDDGEPGVSVVERRYRILDAAGRALRRVTTFSRIRTFAPDDLVAALEECGLHVVEILRGFPGSRASEPRMVVITCESSSRRL